MLRRTSLYEAHARAGAKMVPFAGWEMPVHYGGILDEVRAVRTFAGVFDVSHMGRFHVAGGGALDALQRLLTNDVARLRPGRAQYTLLCNDSGGILDDLIVYRMGGADRPDPFLLVVNAANSPRDLAWITERLGGDVTFADRTEESALLALQGPRAASLLAERTSGTELNALRPFSHTAARFTSAAGDVSVHLARTGYTGEDGFEIVCAATDAAAVWDALTELGARPCGLGARDVLRIEAGYPLYGHEINEETNPYAAGLGWVVKPGKGPFIGRDAMEAGRAAGLPLRLRGLRPDDARAIPREGAEVRHPLGAGRVTSGTFSPTLNRAIGMAYLPADADGAADLLLRGREFSAAIVDLPFYQRPAPEAGASE